jgi:hypothetical protein
MRRNLIRNLLYLGQLEELELSLIKRQENLKGMLSLNMRTKEILNVIILLVICFIEALAKGEGRRVDGRRVKVDYERGRTKSDWLPRRLGGGKGDSRRDRDEEKLIRDLKKSHPLLRPKSRSRSRDLQR